MQPIQIHWFKIQKTVYQFVSEISKSILTFEHFEIKDDP